MTAEIVTMNKEAIALAADSAVTSRVAGGQKIFTSADKIFVLSDHHPVGIMFFNNASFMGIPWDTIVKSFRLSLPKEGFDTLEEYVRCFVSFCENNRILFDTARQRDYVTEFLMGYFFYIQKQIDLNVQSIMYRQGYVTVRESNRIVSEVIASHLNFWRQPDGDVEHSISMPLSGRIVRHYRETIEEAMNMVFREGAISRRNSQRLFEIARRCLSKYTDDYTNSGVVFAGFGEKEIFPSCIPIVLDGVFYNRLKYYRQRGGAHRIGIESEGSIFAFAQSEMAFRFMEGVDPLYLACEQGYMSELPNLFAREVISQLDRCTDSEKQLIEEQVVNSCNQIIEIFNQQMKDFRREQFANAVTDTISLLPKSDLGTLAEALVHLTAIKRRFSLESETVAEPIDVAVISKGDGFIWIKRKHYFKPDLNLGFFKRRYVKEVNRGNN